MEPGRSYFVVAVDSGLNAIKLSETSGGTPIEFSNTGSFQDYIVNVGAIESGTYFAPESVSTIIAGTDPAGLQYDTAVIIKGTSGWGVKNVSGANSTNDTLLVPTTNVSESDYFPVRVTGQPGDMPTSNPAIVPGGIYYAFYWDVGEISLYTDPDGNNAVTFSSNVTGPTLQIKNPEGLWSHAVLESDNPTELPIVIPANRARQFIQKVGNSFSTI